MRTALRSIGPRPGTETASDRGRSAPKALILLLFSILWLGLFPLGVESVGIVLGTLAMAAVALWFGPLALLGSGGRRKIYDPGVLFNFAMLYYSVKGISLGMGVWVPYLRSLTHDDVERSYPLVSLMVAAGLLAWNLGYLRATRGIGIAPAREAGASTARLRVEGVAPVAQERNRAGALLQLQSVLVISAVGIGFLLVFFQSLGGNMLLFLTNPLLRSYVADQTQSASTNVLLFGAYMFPMTTLAWLTTIGARGEKPGVLWWIHAGIGTLMYLLSGGRSDSISFVLGLMLVYHLLVSPVAARTVLLLGAVGLGYAYGMNVWRMTVGSLSRATLDMAGSEAQARFFDLGLLNFLSGVDLTDVRFFVLLSNVFGNDAPPFWGGTLLRLVTQFIPRALWGDKPQDLSVELARIYDPLAMAGTPPGFFAEMYINFLLPGPIIGGLLLGLGLGYMYQRFMIESRSAFGSVMYAVIMPKIVLLPSATFANMVGTVGLLLADLIIVWLALGLTRSHNSQPNGQMVRKGSRVQSRAEGSGPYSGPPGFPARGSGG